MPLPREKTFPASLDSLKEMRDYVAAAAVGLPLDKKKLYKLQLAVDEIAANIILYGGMTGENAKMLMEAELREQSLVIRLQDQGIAFDPHSKLRQEQENLAKPAAERPVGGLGIYLAVTGVDKFSYGYRNGFNVNQFEIYFDTVLLTKPEKKTC